MIFVNFDRNFFHTIEYRGIHCYSIPWKYVYVLSEMFVFGFLALGCVTYVLIGRFTHYDYTGKYCCGPPCAATQCHCIMRNRGTNETYLVTLISM